jgi:hypothetical protein
MTPAVSGRNKPWAPGVLQLENWAQGTSDRGGQDKSRKVRPVGRVGDAFNFKRAPNIANIRRNLPFLVMARRWPAFDTLWLAS